MILSKKNVLYTLFLIYPAISILIAFLFQGNNLILFSLLYSSCIFFMEFNFIKKIEKSICIIILYLIITFSFSLSRENLSQISNVLMYIFTVCSYIFYSYKYLNIKDFSKFLEKNQKIWIISETIFYGILLLDTLKNGLYAGWSTMVIKGPYNYPHTLSYILILMSLIDLYFCYKKKSLWYLFPFGVNIALIVLTAVRTTLLALVIIIAFLMWKFFTQKQIKKLCFVFVFLFLLIFIMYHYGILQSVIDKSLLAIRQNNSFTNGRFDIIQSSLKALDGDGINFVLNCIFGVGMTKLLNNNSIFLNAAIHGHNDFVDVLVSFGVLNLIIYTITFFKFSKKNRLWTFAFLGILAFGNGLYCYIDAIPIIVFVRIFFENVNFSNQDYLKKEK